MSLLSHHFYDTFSGSVSVIEMDERELKQHYAITVCVNLSKTTTETFQKLIPVYREQVSSRAQVISWHKALLEGCKNVEDEP